MKRSKTGACLAIFAAAVLLACTSAPPEERAAPTVPRLAGTWNGTITLTEASGEGRDGPVSFTFGAGEYTVRGSKSIAPPGCGSYQFASTLFLEDRCMHTAEFDWTLILKGVFLVRWDGSTLILDQADSHGRQRHIVLEQVE